MKKRIFSLLMALVLVFGLLPVAAFAAEGGHGHVTDAPDSDCIVCRVAGMINALPAAEDITVDNVAEVIDRIHAIDRVKFELSDEQYVDLLGLIETVPNEQGGGYPVPKAYTDAVEAIKKFGGNSLVVFKSFVGYSDEEIANAVVEFTITGDNGFSQTLTMSTMDHVPDSLSADSDFYTADADGWTYKYILPAGSYTITETANAGAASTTYKVGDVETSDSASFSVGSGETRVSVMNSYSPPLTVSNNVVSPLEADQELEFRYTVILEDSDFTRVSGDMQFDCGKAIFILKGDESATANIPSGVEYIVTCEENEWFTSSFIDTNIGSENIPVYDVQYTHTRQTGDLSVTNNVIGDSDTAFDFTVTLSDATINKPCGEMNFEEGIAKFSLKNGETVLATGIPAGIEYKVTVAYKEGFVCQNRIDHEGLTSEFLSQATFFHIPTIVTHTVIFMNGEEEWTRVACEHGETLAISGMPIPDAPDGKVFAGWYTEDGTHVVHGMTVTGDIIAYATWKDAPTPPAPIRPIGPPIYVHTCTSKCEVCGGCEDADCNFLVCDDKCLLPMNFSDVAEGEWYYEAVEYAYHRSMMEGLGDGEFAPDSSTTRAMIWTILARLDGVDTDGEVWYEAGREWAMANGISDGTMPCESISREQFVTMLWRFAQYKGYDTSAAAEFGSFKDAESVSGWAEDAMKWAIGCGLMQGDGVNLTPGAPATRAQAAALLMRFCEKLK